MRYATQWWATASVDYIEDRLKVALPHTAPTFMILMYLPIVIWLQLNRWTNDGRRMHA